MVYPPDLRPWATGQQGICSPGGLSATLRGGNRPYGSWLPAAIRSGAVRPAQPKCHHIQKYKVIFTQPPTYIPVWIQMHGPDVAVLAAGDDNVVGDGDEGVHPVRVAGELVAVQAVLTPGRRG